MRKGIPNNGMPLKTGRKSVTGFLCVSKNRDEINDRIQARNLVFAGVSLAPELPAEKLIHIFKRCWRESSIRGTVALRMLCVSKLVLA